jgi:riboflavin biosynthesis pyrimidine reductase
MHVVGGATLVSSLLNEGLINELQLLINPLGEATAVFELAHGTDVD